MPEPVMKFEVTGPTGESGTVDDQYLLQNLTAAGYQAQGISPDGTKLTLVDEQGPYEVRVEDAIKNLGWGFGKMAPMNADYSGVMPEWRAMTHTLPDDASRKAFLIGQLTNMGHQAPEVIGSGRDWYAFSPEDNKWIGLTNSPDWELSDAAEAGLIGGRALASAGGALAGAAGGGLGAIPGAALGGAGFDIAARGIMAASNPNYRVIASDNLPGMAGDIALGAGIDAATMGAAKLLSPGGVMGAIKAPISSIGRPIGRFAEEVGRGVEKLGGFMGKELPSEIATAVAAAPDVMTGTIAAQLPKDIITGVPRAAGAVAESNIAKKFMGDTARSRMLNWSKDLLKPRVPNMTMAEEMAAGMQRAATPRPYSPSARDVATNIADRFRAAGPMFGTGNAGVPTAASNFIEGAGRVADLASDAGQAIQRPIVGAVQAGFKGVGAMGSGLRAGGQALRTGSTLGQALEAPAYGQMSYQEWGRPWWQKAEEQYRPVRRAPRRPLLDEPISHD